MSEQTPRDPAPEPQPTVDDVMDVDDDALPRHSRRDPSRGMPEHPDEDALQRATDPDPEGTSADARAAEQGLEESEVHDYTADGRADQELLDGGGRSDEGSGG